MLTQFPALLSYSFFAPTLLRAAAAVVIALLALTHVRREDELEAIFSPLVSKFAPTFAWLLVIIEAAVAIALFVGYRTQVAAIAGALLALMMLLAGPRIMAPRDRSAAFLLLVVCISLLALGAGAFAFDLPL